MRLAHSGARLIPPELRYHIAQSCDKATLTQLALVQALWASICEPVLYERICLCIGKSTKDSYATCACLRTLSTSPRKASMVRALLVWYMPDSIALRDDAQPFDNSHIMTRLVCETLPYLRNLVDLRIRPSDNDFHSKTMCDGLARALAGEDCGIALRTLYIPHKYAEHAAMQIVQIIRSQCDTLRVLALLDWFPMHSVFSWYTAGRALHADCVIFAIGYVGGTGRETEYDKLVHQSTEPARIRAVVRSLEADPPLSESPHAPNFDLRNFRSIELRADEIPDAARMRLLAQSFPRCENLTLTSLASSPAALLDPAGLAASVSNFPHLVNLFLSADGKQSDLAPLGRSVRESIARAAVRAGCSALVSVVFPDESGLSRDEGGEDWATDSEQESDRFMNPAVLSMDLA